MVKEKKENKNQDETVKTKTDQDAQSNIPFWKKKDKGKEFLKRQLKRQFFGGGKKRGVPFGRRGI